MQKRIVKNIHKLVADKEVTFHKDPESKNTVKVKKRFWNTLNWIEQTKRLKLLNAK